MGLETENPVEFLTRARTAVISYNETQKSLTKQREAEKQASRALDQAKRDMHDKTEKTLKAREAEITASYDQQIKEVEARLKKATALREKAKNEGIKGRIQAETEPLRTENKELKRQAGTVLSQDHAPIFTHTGLFYWLFKPSGFKEILIFILTFLLAFAVIPIGIYYMIPSRQSLYLVPIYLVDIILLGGLYLFINGQTNGRHREAISMARGLRNQIKANRRKIRAIAHAVQTDANEEGYHLQEYDDDIAKAQQDRTDIITQKQSAENTFATVTRNIITDEIESAARSDIERLAAEFSSATKARSALETEEKDQALRLSGEFEQFLGKKHMNVKDIDTIRHMLDKQEAISIVDAVSKLDHPAK